jgi:hypothetical protein
MQTVEVLRKPLVSYENTKNKIKPNKQSNEINKPIREEYEAIFGAN